MFQEFLLNTQGDMVERGMIIAAIVAVAIALWLSIGQKIAEKLNAVNGQL